MNLYKYFIQVRIFGQSFLSEKYMAEEKSCFLNFCD